MKQAQNARKQRGRSATRKGGKSNTGGGNRSNEPKVRGNPKQLLEKYKTQAREAKQAGDRVQAEYFYQFADHYQRILNEMNARNGGQQGRDESDDTEENTSDADQDRGKQRRSRGRRQPRSQEGSTENGADAASDTVSDPAVTEQPVEVHPELDLDGTAAPAADEEKPKRRRAPAQRRRSPKPKADGGESADATPAANPEGNEAA